MSALLPHPHVAMDRYPQLVRELAEAFGSDGIGAVVDRIIAAELGDFCWEARIAERALGPVAECLDEDEIGPCARVGILGYFRDRYHVATCIVDVDRRLRWMLRVRYFDDYNTAKSAFEGAR